MLPIWTKAALVLPVVWMSWQDFRNRHISVWVLLVLAVGTIGFEWLSAGAIKMLTGIGINLCLLLFMFGGVILWLMAGKKEEAKSLKKYIGSGDVAFMIALTPLFELREFLYWLIVSMIVALLWWIVIHRVTRDNDLTVPLVGIMGIVLSIWIVINIIV